MNRHIRSNAKAGNVITVVQELPAPEDGGQNPMRYTLSTGASAVVIALECEEWYYVLNKKRVEEINWNGMVDALRQYYSGPIALHHTSCSTIGEDKTNICFAQTPPGPYHTRDKGHDGRI